MAEKVQVDLATTGADKAAADVAKVADAVERLEDADAVTVTAEADTGDATRGLTDVADAVDDLDGTDATVTAEADTETATRGLTDVADAVEALDGTDAHVTATVDNQTSGPLADVMADLDKLKTRAHDTSEQLDRVGGADGGGGSHLRGQAIADLTGPLGDVSGQASDLAGVFDGLGDTLAGLGGRFGLSADAIEGALGGVSFAVAGAVALWGLWRQQQQKAREELAKTVDEQRKLNDLLEQGKFDDAAKALVSNYGDVYDAAKRAGIPVQEVTDFLAGYSDQLPTATARMAELTSQMDANNSSGADAVQQYGLWIAKITEARDGIDQANGTIADQDSLTRQASDALAKNADAAQTAAEKQDELTAAASRTNDQFDRMSEAVNLTTEFHRFNDGIDEMQQKVESGTGLASDDIDGLKADIIQLARDAKANPAEVSSTLDKIDRGDLAGVKADAESYYRNSPVQVQAKITSINAALLPSGWPVTGGTNGAAVTRGVGGLAAAPMSFAETVNVTQYLPRGWRGDALVAARKAARRSGGLYQRAAR
jgi:uncharacterized phage infection (PIP) family protein YhgE